jgi:hypothetical protein
MRRGVEAKPPRRAVPTAVRHEVDRLFESPVVRAARVWGGYSPTPTFRLTLADGLLTIATMTGERQEEALAWLEQVRPTLNAAAQAIVDTREPLILLHSDSRSDNLCLRDGRLVLFDWP